MFLGLAAMFGLKGAAAVALLAGLTAPGWPAGDGGLDPAAWAWPMAIALLCAPVIYPWYLLYLTPFLWTLGTLPLLAWCLSGLAAYDVWEISRTGGRWIVPAAIQAFELGVPLVVSLALYVTNRRTAAQGPGQK